MNTYDPKQAPDPERWSEWDESERLDLVMAYHQSAGIELPNTRIHAAFHTIVENQLAEGLTEVQTVLDRLLGEGLDRHDALHAIGSVVAEHVQGILQEGSSEGSSDGDSNQAYFRQLEELTAEKWLASGQE